MSHDKYISDAERALFRKAVSDVKPLKTTTEPVIQPAEAIIESNVESKTRLTIQIKKRPQQPLQTAPPVMMPDNIASGIDSLSFCRPGIQHKLFTQLRQGKLPVDATLDLHSHTAEQAIQATQDFLAYCRTQHYRVVCVIHGKGLSSPEGPVIKNVLNHYLRQYNDVLAFHSAKPRDGGTGAMYVLLKK